MVALRKKLVVAAAAVAAGTIGLGGIGVPLVDVAVSAPAHLPSANGTLWVTDRTGALGSVKVFEPAPDGGHEILPIGGQQKSPRTVT